MITTLMRAVSAVAWISLIGLAFIAWAMAALMVVGLLVHTIQDRLQDALNGDHKAGVEVCLSAALLIWSVVQFLWRDAEG